MTTAIDPTLATWFRADDLTLPGGTAVSLWPDSSGHGFHATQSDPARRPRLLRGTLNGHDAVRFTAASATQLAFARPVSGDFTIVAVFGSAQGVGRGDAWYGAAGIVDGEVTGVTRDFGLSLNALGQVLAGTGGPDTFLDSGLGFDDGRAHVAAFTRSAATGATSLHVDGRLFERATGATGALSAPPRLTIGSNQTNTNYFTGDIAEIRIYSAPLPDASRAAIETELRTTYNVAPLPANWFDNPVIDRDFPDPGGLYAGGYYYAFATNGGGVNVRAARSTNLVNWSSLPDALPNLPSWAQAGRTWAPDLAVTATGRYNLYYTAWSRNPSRQAIGVATGSSPTGPFTPAGSAPLVSQFTLGGAIDPSVFTDSSGVQYLLWKNDGNAVGQTTWIYIQRLAPDGLSLVGSPTQLIRQTLPWEGTLVEAPVLWAHGGRYYLFYSANFYGDGSYATGYAVADSLLGPYTKSPQPLMSSEGPVVGPGGPEILVGPDGNTWLLYHSWENNRSYRATSADRLDWVNGAPVVRGPSRELQPVPQPARVVDRQVFYNDSAFDGGDPGASHLDDGAIATNKFPLFSAGSLFVQHVTSYDKGINGLMVDVAHLPREYVPSAGDFEFLQAPTLRHAMTAAPVPAMSVRRGAGFNGADRITFTWGNNAVRNGWLRVTVWPQNWMPLPDNFYFGNLVGETGDAMSSFLTDWTVTAHDYARTRAAISRAPAPVTSHFDFNRDGRVNATDLWISRAGQPRAATATVTALTRTEDVIPVTPRPAPRRRGAWDDLPAAAAV